VARNWLLPMHQVYVRASSEFIVTMKETEYMIQACADAGKPGLYLGRINSAVTPEAIIATIVCSKVHPLRLQASIHPFPECKYFWSHFKIVLFCKYYGMHVWNGGVASIGGLCRNPVEAAISRIGQILSNLGLSNGASASAWSVDMKGMTSARRNLG